LGTSPTDAALVDQWVSFVDSEVGSKLYMLIAMLRGHYAYSKPIETVLREKLHEALAVLNTYLTHNTFLLPTNRLSLADITFASIIKMGFETVIDAKQRQQLPSIVRLYETVVNQSAIKDIFGQTNYAETSLQFTPPKKEKAPHPPAAATKPHKEKKPVVKDDDDDDEEPSAPPEPKVKNPLDDLPKSAFNLEDWKRAYSNMDTRGEASSLKWFYDK
jgi:elongation factor 1-gamma